MMRSMMVLWLFRNQNINPIQPLQKSILDCNLALDCSCQIPEGYSMMPSWWYNQIKILCSGCGEAFQFNGGFHSKAQICSCEFHRCPVQWTLHTDLVYIATQCSRSKQRLHLTLMCWVDGMLKSGSTIGVFRVDVSIVIQYPFLSRFWSDL